MLSLKRPRRTSAAAPSSLFLRGEGEEPASVPHSSYTNTSEDAALVWLDEDPISAVVPNDEVEDDGRIIQQQLQSQILLRRVIRPIAMRPQDAEAFYEQACREFSLPVVHQAVQASYAWHRHWTTETGRLEAVNPEATTASEEETESQQQPLLIDRCRNPSPQGSSRSCCDSPAMLLEEDHNNRKEAPNALAQRRVVVHKRGRADGTASLLAQTLEPVEVREEPPTSTPPQQVLIRPQAMRIAVRREDVQPAHLVQDDDNDDESANRHCPATTLPPSQSSILVPRTSGGTEDLGASSQQRPRHPPCSHFNIIANNSASERSISPLTVDADLFRDEDILQTVEASATPAHIVLDDDEDEPSVLTMMDHDPMVSSVRSSEIRLSQPLAKARECLLQELAVTAGETNSETFQSALQLLQSSQLQHHHQPPSHTGLWLTLTKPTFFDCLGVNGNGDPLYTLGRMSFGLCAPTQLVCSLQGNFNRLERVEATTGSVPKSLRQELLLDCGHLETYDIITAFTIEPHSPSFPHDAPNRDVTRPIRGIMTTYGYIIPDPLTPNRYTVWISGGRLEPDATPANVTAWKSLFAAHPPQHTLTEHAKLLAVQWLMGATLPRVVDTTTGAMEYTFERPLGGHGITYLDNLYTDDSLRIWRGHRGTTFVMARTSR